MRRDSSRCPGHLLPADRRTLAIPSTLDIVQTPAAMDSSICQVGVYCILYDVTCSHSERDDAVQYGSTGWYWTASSGISSGTVRQSFQRCRPVPCAVWTPLKATIVHWLNLCKILEARCRVTKLSGPVHWRLLVLVSSFYIHFLFLVTCAVRLSWPHSAFQSTLHSRIVLYRKAV